MLFKHVLWENASDDVHLLLLLQVVVATLIASLIKVDDRYDVEVVGDIPTGYVFIVLIVLLTVA